MRRYGIWAGRPKGVPEDPKRCLAEVNLHWTTKQCSRPRGPSGLCKQHRCMEIAGQHLAIPEEGD